MSEDSEYQRKHRPGDFRDGLGCPNSSKFGAGTCPRRPHFLEPLTPWEPHRWPVYSEGGGRGPTLPLHVLAPPCPSTSCLGGP